MAEQAMILKGVPHAGGNQKEYLRKKVATLE